MYSVASWNIRGLNRTPKQREVRQVINENNLNVCAILESHVDIGKLEKVCSKVCSKWEWTSNASYCRKGSRIILGWNDDEVDVMVLTRSSQVIHTQIMLKADRKVLFCSFIYASNSYKTCRELWQNLCMHKLFVNGRAWALLGDFNSSIFIEDTYYGSSKINISMREFNDCVESVEILDVNCTGLHYTWNQKPNGDYGILKKIDRVMANLGFAGDFPGSYAVFQSYRISDHAPAVLKIRKISYDKPKPFKFFNFLSYKPEFLQVVKDQWGTNVNGHNMFRLVKRLQGLKKPLRKLLHAQGNIHERVNRLRHELDEVQKALDINSSSSSLRDEEAAYLNAFTQATLDEERYLKQKAKIEWLRVGDTNSGYFHRSVKAKVSRSRIDCVTGHDNVLYEGKAVPSIFVDHYKVFLGSEAIVANMNGDGLFMNKLHSDKALFMVRQVTNDEIKDAIFNIGNDKAPEPDGFTSVFF
ncbi:putative RNA-directed DNA polymerase, partial [Tanacetum coccineum]